MYMTYYKRPELTIFDEDECKKFPLNYKTMWAAMEGNLKSDNLRFYKGDELQTMTSDEKRMSLMKLSSRINTDIGMGKFAHTDFNVYYVSRSFGAAMAKCYDKLRPLMDEENALQGVFEDSVFINGDFTFVFMRLTEGNYRFMYFDHGYLAHFSDFSIDESEGTTLRKFKDMETVTCIDCDGYEDIWTPDLILYQQSFILFFKKYGNVDLEIIPAKQTVKKPKLLFGKVNNFMGIDVRVLDSRWFTTICRDEGFLVSGHFRLQPCKDENGEWTRKLIYINPYAKHGYHRLAPIVNLNEE